MKKILIFILALLLFNSCYDDFLENDPQGMGDVITTLKDENTAELVLYGIYAQFQPNAAYGRNFWIYGDLMSGDAIEAGESGCNDPMNLREFQRYTFTSSNTSIGDFYSVMYRGIGRANNMINNAEPFSDKMAQYIGEARVLRCFFYFDLVRVFGAVPLVKDPVKFTDAASIGNRDIEGDETGEKQILMIYDFLVEELRAVIKDNKLLPEQPGYVSMMTAKGLLAKILMFKYSHTNDVNEAKEAVTLVDDIFAYKGKPIVKYANIFSDIESYENSHESLFEIQFIDGNADQYDGAQNGEGSLRVIDQTFRNVMTKESGQWQRNNTTIGYGLNAPTERLVKSFEVDKDKGEFDPRLHMIAKGENVLFSGQSRDSALVYSSQPWGVEKVNNLAYYPIAVEASPTGFFHRKTEERRGIFNPAFGDGSQVQGLNHILLRYADVLLIGAEAAVIAGQNDKALLWINAVRERARKSKIIGHDMLSGEYTYGESTVPADLSSVTLEQIRTERRLELFCEGQTFFDLVRYGTADEVLGAITEDACGEKCMWKSYNKVLPLPSTQILQHGGKIKQNEGYN